MKKSLKREKLIKIMFAGFLAVGMSLFSNATVHAGETGLSAGYIQTGYVNSRISAAESRPDKVSAMTAAIAKLGSMGYKRAAPAEIAVSAGWYGNNTVPALGVFYYPSRDFMLSASVSTVCNEIIGGAGATWKLRRKSSK